MKKEIEIPEGYEARIEGNKVILEPKESEDERIRKELYAFINTVQHSYLCANYTKREKWLAYLEKQKEQKPAEWSEEDVERLAKIRMSKSGTLKSEMEFYRQGARDAFKSLRPQPHWKPSEEQVEALNKVIENHSSLLKKDDILSPIIKLCTELEAL